MGMLFDIVPRRFFNPLAAVTNGSSGQICASCLLSFNQLFASEAQVPREEVRDAVVDVLAAGNITGIDDPLLEPEAEAKDDFLAARKEKNMSQEQVSDEDEEIRLRMDLANRILKYLSDEEVGWIEEGVDNGTLHRTFMITEQAMLLADYIERASSQKFDEMSNYLYNSYLVVTDFSKNVEDRMNNHPYTSVILNVYSNIVKLNGQLKLLRRSIRRIVKKVTGSLSFDELMDHLSEYLDGEFIGEFTRLINNENA
ncbi:MAG: Wadjet anti-phage system protein JetA family protein, partial [Bilifractor sp.]